MPKTAVWGGVTAVGAWGVGPGVWPMGYLWGLRTSLWGMGYLWHGGGDLWGYLWGGLWGHGGVPMAWRPLGMGTSVGMGVGMWCGVVVGGV